MTERKDLFDENLREIFSIFSSVGDSNFDMLECCDRIYSILKNIGIEFDFDGLSQCLFCLNIKEPAEKVYDVPKIGKICKTHYPIDPIQFFGAVLVMLVLKLSNLSCDVICKESENDACVLGEVEIICMWHVFTLRSSEITHESFEKLPASLLTLQYEE